MYHNALRCTHLNDNRLLAARSGLPPHCQQKPWLGKHSRGRRQIGWLVLCARWRLQITRKHRGEKTGWERVTGGRRGFSESSLPFFSGQIGHRGKLRHSRNGLIRDVLDDLWLACPSFFWEPLQVYKRLTVPSRPIVNHHPSQSHCDLHDVYC